MLPVSCWLGICTQLQATSQCWFAYAVVSISSLFPLRFEMIDCKVFVSAASHMTGLLQYYCCLLRLMLAVLLANLFIPIGQGHKVLSRSALELYSDHDALCSNCKVIIQALSVHLSYYDSKKLCHQHDFR